MRLVELDAEDLALARVVDGDDAGRTLRVEHGDAAARADRPELEDPPVSALLERRALRVSHDDEVRAREVLFAETLRVERHERRDLAERLERVRRVLGERRERAEAEALALAGDEAIDLVGRAVRRELARAIPCACVARVLTDEALGPRDDAAIERAVVAEVDRARDVLGSQEERRRALERVEIAARRPEKPDAPAHRRNPSTT